MKLKYKVTVKFNDGAESIMYCCNYHWNEEFLELIGNKRVEFYHKSEIDEVIILELEESINENTL